LSIFKQIELEMCWCGRVCGWDMCLQAFCECDCSFWCFLWMRWSRCGRSMRKTNFFPTTILLSSNNNTTKFQLHLQFFAHVTLLMAGPGFQYFKHYHCCWQCGHRRKMA